MDKQRRRRVNIITKAVSILLIVVMLFVFLPETMTVLAEEIKSAGGESEQSQQVEQEQESTYEPDFSVEDMHSTPAEQEEAYILYEAEYKRSEYEKHFYMSDGTYMRETYAMPIHYLDGEEYKDIDNTLVEYTEGGKEKIKNAGNSFTAEFAKEISEDEPLLSVTKGEYSLQMYYEQKGGEKVQQARLGEQDKATIRPVQAEIKADKAKVQKEEISYAGKKLKDSIKNENLESELRYEGVEQDTDFEYKLDSSSVKESIIVGSRQQSYTYSFRLQTQNLFLELTNYGSITAYNGQEEEIYTIPAPYMFDAAGNRSEAVTYELKYTDDSDYILSVIADSEWINAEDREFPVTIDPTIETTENSNNFKFTKIKESGIDSNSGHTISQSGVLQDVKRLVVQYRKISDKRVTHRELRFRLAAWTAVVGYRYNHNFDYEVTWESTQEAMYCEYTEEAWLGGTMPLDYYNAEGAIYFIEEDRGFVFRCEDESGDVISQSAQFFNFKVVEYYDDEMGIESSYNPLSYDGGDYTLYVKPRTKTYTVEIPYISLEAPSVPLSVTAYYNPGFSSLRSSLDSETQNYYGANIKLNIEQYIKPLYNESGSDDAVLYLYLDADGSIHRFLPYDTDKYLCPELGYTYIPSTKEVKDSADFTIMEFDANGSLIRINSKNGDFIRINYGVANKILNVENYISGAPYQGLAFTYNGNKLTEIAGTFSTVPMFWELDEIEKTTKAILTYQGNYLKAVQDSQQNYRVRVTHTSLGDLVSNRYNVGHEVERSTDGETVVFNVYYIDSNGDKSRADQFYGGINYVQRNNYNDMLNKNPGFELLDSMVTYGFSNDKTVTSQWSEDMENDHAPINVTNTVVEKTEEKTVTTTVTATYDQKNEKRGFFEPYYNFSQDIAMPINGGYLDEFNNPVFACLLTSGTGFEGSIYYKDGDQIVKSATADGGSITLFGMFLLLPLPKTATEIGVTRESDYGTGAYLQRFGIAELVSKTVTEIYVKDVKNANNEVIHKEGDTKITTVTPEGTTVTHISEEKTLKEEYVSKADANESLVTTYTYNDDDLLTKAVTVTTVGDEVTTQTTSYTYNGYLLESVTTRIDNETLTEDKTYTESYSYDDFGHMLSHTTTDNHEYTYEYIKIWECAEILPYRVYLDEELIEEYTYDTYGKLLSITDKKSTMEYLYNGNKFSGYKSGDTTYGYTLGENGNVSGVTRNGVSVISYYGTRDKEYGMTYANGDNVGYGYKKGYALTGVTYSNGATVQAEYSYYYDMFGTLKSITNQADITKTYSQNNAARTYTETVTGANYLYENIAHYDSNGYYTGSNYTFTHGTLASQDAEREIGVEYKSYLQGLIGSTTDGDFTSSYNYNAENFISEITQTLGEESISTAYEYDENNRLTKVTVNDTIYRLTYDYMGNITAVTKNNAEYLTYSYDDAGRLISENNTNFSYSYTYTYDGNNNIATVAETSKPTQDSPELPLLPARTTTNTYVYEGDKLLGKRGAGSMSNLISYTSDANGNLTNYGGRELTWKQGGKLNTVEERADRPSITGAMQYNTYRYSYDENGLRYKKVNTVNGVTTETRYFLDGSTIIAEEAGGNLTQYYYDNTGVIGMRYNNVNYYFVKDLFGNVHQVLHQDGTRVAEYEYDAWGNCEITFDRWDIYDQSKSKIADKNPFRYRGYYMDVETGYYYLQSRYYDPAIRRFISSDNYGLLSTLAEAGDINMFVYCGNNPVMCVDPTGKFPVDTIIDIGFALWSLIDLIRNPSWENAGWFALDLACLIIPYATGGSTAVKGIVKGVNGADNLLDASKVPGYIMRNADNVVLLGQNMDRVYDASRKIGGGIIYGGLDDFGEIALKYGQDVANSIGYLDNMKWVAKQAWSGKTVLNIGLDLSRLGDPIRYANSFKVCKGELFWYKMVMSGKFIAFWSHRIYRLLF